MSASTLQKKKNAISKGKMKKTIKNILCRPDPVSWPAVLEDKGKDIDLELAKYKIEIPKFNKLPWSELKSIPKEQRPKPPKIQKVDGLIFGITECLNAVQSDECSAVVIEATVNPRTLMHSVIESCNSSDIPVVCCNGLRNSTRTYFGIATSCLGIKKDLPKLVQKITVLSKEINTPKNDTAVTTPKIMDITENDVENENAMDIQESIQCPYLFRNDKSSRVFVPPCSENTTSMKKEFAGQKYIGFSKETTDSKRKSYLNMMVKRISSNPNRLKSKEK